MRGLHWAIALVVLAVAACGPATPNPSGSQARPDAARVGLL